jgi:hypothetical protein
LGNGVILTSPVSVVNPPTVVDLSEPGWVDFGHGVPPSWLGARIVDGLAFVTSTTDEHNYTLGVLSDHLAAAMQEHGLNAADIAELLRVPRHAVESVLGAGRRRPAIMPIRRNDDGSEEFGYFPPGGFLRAVRQARGLSLRDAVSAATGLPSHNLEPVTLHAVRAAEADKFPRIQQLIPRLDMAYRCDGRLTYSVLQKRRARRHEVIFPDYWVGPVWLEFSPVRTVRSRVDLRWGEVWRPLEVNGHTSVTFRQADPQGIPLEIACAEEWSVVAGLGVHRSAVDVNANWIPREEKYQEQVIQELLAGLMKVSGKDGTDFDSFLARRYLPER